MQAIQYIDRKTGKLITEKPLGERYLRFLYHNPFGSLALHLLVKRKLLSEFYGRMMDRPRSVKKIPKFVKDLNIDMSEAQKSISAFHSFNDFFYRKLKETARPIGEGLVSPADAKLLAFENLAELSSFFVKGQKFTLHEFLQSDSLAQKYKNASLFIFRLAPNDYHRFHFPYDGYVSNTTNIKGSYYSVSPYALQSNFTKVFCENKRAILSLETKDKRNILLIPIGATMVGSIIETFTPHTKITKGEEMGYFAFGGSTVVMLVDKDQLVIDTDILSNTKMQIETTVRMGERIAV